MAIWSDLFEPAEVTGFARAALQDLEEAQGNLTPYLPNEEVNDISVRFEVGEAGLIEVAEYRAYDAEPTLGREANTPAKLIELPAVGQKRVLGEYKQLRLRNASDDELRKAILKNLQATVEAVSNRVEATRGIILETGIATVNQRNFNLADDFGRPAGNNITVPALWSDPAVDRVTDLQNALLVYQAANNGVSPDVMLMSTRAYNALRRGTQFHNVVTGRPMVQADINAILVDEGLPPIRIYDRVYRNRGANANTRIIADNKILFLKEGGSMGRTWWGQTLSASELDWGIEPAEAAGIVAAVLRNGNVPPIVEVVADAISLPVLGNAALSLSLTVL